MANKMVDDLRAKLKSVADNMNTAVSQGFRPEFQIGQHQDGSYYLARFEVWAKLPDSSEVN